MNGFCCHFQKSEKKVTHPQKKIRISKHPTSKFWLPFACTQRLCSVLQISHAFAFKHTLAHNHTGCVDLEPTRSGRRVQPWPPAVCSAGDQQVATRLCRGESAASLCSARMLATHESLEVDLLHGACSRLRPRLLRPRDCGRRATRATVAPSLRAQRPISCGQPTLICSTPDLVRESACGCIGNNRCDVNIMQFVCSSSPATSGWTRLRAAASACSSPAPETSCGAAASDAARQSRFICTVNGAERPREQRC